MIKTEKTPQARFVITSEDIYMALSPLAIVTYMALRYEANYKAECSPVTRKIKFLSSKTKISARQVSRCLNELELNGLVQRNSILGEQTTYLVAKTLGYFNKGIGIPLSHTPEPEIVCPEPEIVCPEPDSHTLLIENSEYLTEEGQKKEYARAEAPAGFSFKPPSRFLEFWNAYPKKEGELICRRIWEKKGLDSITDAILEKLENQIKYDEKFKAGFIFSPRNYLQDERWRDEIARPIKQKEEEKEEEKEEVVEVNKKTLRQYVKVDNKLIRNPNYGVL